MSVHRLYEHITKACKSHAKLDLKFPKELKETKEKVNISWCLIKQLQDITIHKDGSKQSMMDESLDLNVAATKAAVTIPIIEDGVNFSDTTNEDN